MMKKFLLLFYLISFFICNAFALTPKELFKNDVKKSASNYCAYPSENLPKLTAAPVGYQPFHIEHYGRHGSRWLINPDQYSYPYTTLLKAQHNGKITARGKEVMDELQKINEKAKGRLGELTDVGAEQHKGIAKRMYSNFPEVFTDSAKIDARSTIVIRCILSMENECQEFKALNPNLRITHDASSADMYYMNYSDSIAQKYRQEAKKEYKKFEKRLINPSRFVKQLISDDNFIKDSINTSKFMTRMFDVASNMQSHKTSTSFYNLFNDDEVYNLWKAGNAYWYINFGPSPLTKNRIPYSQSNLLKNIIASADRAIGQKTNSATLRFGHEVCVLPLACLLELNNCNEQIEKLDDIEKTWQDYNIFPMACNVQLIFYKSDYSDDILVKALFNEKEATLPVDSNMKPYYHWNDVKAYYERKLDN